MLSFYHLKFIGGNGMKVSGRMSHKLRNREVTLAFAKHSKKLDNLFAKVDKRMGLNGEHGLDQIRDEEHLLELLYDGQFLYWDLVTNEFDEILAIKPYSVHQVMKNLYAIRLKEIKDVFADFESRL